MTDTLLAPAHDDEAHVKHHPSDRDYVVIALTLAFLTALEVIWSYQGPKGGPGLYLPLLAIMAIKFYTVASAFMHLRFDKPVLTRLFYMGLGLACLVFTIAMSTMHIWQKHGPIKAG